MGTNVRQGNTTGKRNLAAHDKRMRALELRREGATYDVIAKAVGYANRGIAHRAVTEALELIEHDSAEETLTLELNRLDAMIAALWPKVRKGDDRAVHAVLRCMERRAKLLGLDDFDARMATVAERRIALEEAQALVIVSLLHRVVDQLDLTAEQRELADVVVPRELRLLEGGAA